MMSKFIASLEYISNGGNFIKKGILLQVFSCEFCEISKNTFPTQDLWTTIFVTTLTFTQCRKNWYEQRKKNRQNWNIWVHFDCYSQNVIYLFTYSFFMSFSKFSFLLFFSSFPFRFYCGNTWLCFQNIRTLIVALEECCIN